MLNINEIMERATKEGYTVHEVTVIKNGVEYNGHTFKKADCNIAPTLYDLETYPSIEAVFEKVAKAYEGQSNFNTDLVMSKEYILNNSISCLQKPSNENIVKESFCDLEKYIRVIVDNPGEGIASFKLTKEHLKYCGLTENEVLESATENARHQAIIKDFMGMPIVTNEANVNGANAILNSDLLSEICISHNVTKAYIIPSSIHECIVMPYDESLEREYIDNMVTEVNANVVDEAEVLGTHSYIFDRDTKEITY